MAITVKTTLEDIIQQRLRAAGIWQLTDVHYNRLAQEFYIRPVGLTRGGPSIDRVLTALQQPFPDLRNIADRVSIAADGAREYIVVDAIDYSDADL